MRFPTVAIVVVALLAGTSATASAQSRTDPEPNDTLADAVETGLVDQGTYSLAGACIGNGDSPERDVDYFRLEISTNADLPAMLTVSVETPLSFLDGYLCLYDALGGRLESADDDAYPQLDPVLRTYLLTAGSYYVAVSACAFQTQGAYDLAISLVPTTPPASALEPNDTHATATDTGGPPPSGYQVLGEFIGDGTEARMDIDVYRLDLTAPSLIEASVAVEHLDSTLHPALTLRSPAGTLALDDKTELDSRDAHLRAAVFVGGDYYLEVTGVGNVLPLFDPALRAPGSVGYYDLTITTTPLPGAPADPAEPNDSILQATPSGLFGPGQVQLLGTIGNGPYAATRGDVDVYQVGAGYAEFLTVDLDAAALGSALDTLVVVYDYYGTVIATNDNDGVTTDSYLSVPVPWWTFYDDVYVMVTGTRQARPLDPFVPNPVAGQPCWSEHVVAGESPVLDDYLITITLSASRAAADNPLPSPARAIVKSR
ncbi:MAG TPA: hypothetical protein VM243_14655 [Phycisphaerae bacterium]|nr:hypothetical protein [Phycisphaerae bacterium]